MQTPYRPCRRVASTRRVLALIASLAVALPLAGCWPDDDSSPDVSAHALGGTVEGLASAGLTLTDGSETVSLQSGSTHFVFATPLPSGTAYTVAVATQPSGAVCTVTGGSGTMGDADVTAVQVQCTPTGYTIGGAITGLGGSGLVLANGSNTVSPASGATGFTLPGSVVAGATYDVVVQAQPAGQQCSVSQATGTVANGNVTDVAVSCAAAAHALGGTISGLVSAGLVLANGSDTVTPVVGASAFQFTRPVAEGGGYAVTVATQPLGLACSVANADGTMGSADIATVQVTCAPDAYHLGGVISGLTTSGLVLANGSSTVSPASGAATFQFAQTVAYGGSYSVIVKQQPTGQSCVVSGSFPATMGAADVTNVSVSCSAATAFVLIAGQETCPVGNRFAEGSGSAALLPPNNTAIAIDAAGNFYIDYASAIVKVTPAGTVTLLAGSMTNTGQVDGSGTAALFSGFSVGGGLAADSTGNLFMSDEHEIRRITQAGVVTTMAGAAGSISGDVDGTGSAARFYYPSALAVDSAGNVFISDSNNQAIRQMSPAGVVTTLAGGGAGHFGFVDGTGSAARFATPEGLGIDAAGNLYVVDWGNQAIRKVTPAGVVTTLAGGGGSAGGFVDGTGSAARFNFGTGLQTISVDSAGNLYVTDQSNHAMRKVTPAGAVTTVAVTQDFASHTGLTAPAGVPALPIGTAYNTTWRANRNGALVFPVGCALETTTP